VSGAAQHAVAITWLINELALGAGGILAAAWRVRQSMSNISSKDIKSVASAASRQAWRIGGIEQIR